MKERPILFSTPMVKAILDGRKTMTRRVLNESALKVIPRRKITGDMIFANIMVKGGQTTSAIMNRCGAVSGKATNGEWLGLKPEEFDFVCPYCGGFTELIESKRWTIHSIKGSSLWVRESWREVGSLQMADSSIPEWGKTDQVVYKADESWNGPFRPSIHMPRWASRITLEVKAVRIERVQDISEEDAESEGVDFIRHYPDADETLTAKQLFECLWDSINAKRGFGWDSNPWVWAIEFKRV